MPRGSKTPVTDGWVQIIRGPRPKSESRFQGTPTVDETVGARQCPSAAQHQSPPRSSRRRGKFGGRTIARSCRCVGEGNPLSAPLQAALRSARTKSKVLPVNERIEACKKGLVRTEAVIAKAQEQKAIFETELRDGEAWLAQLQSLSEEQRGQPVGPSVIKLQRRVDQLVQECDALKAKPPRKELPGVWTDGVPPNLQEVPPIPGDRQDLEAWLSCRNCELRNALEFGDAATMARVGALVAQGSAKMATFAQDVPMHGQGKSFMMAALID